MKKLNQTLFAVVAVLAFAGTAFAEQTYTAAQARDILSTPEKFTRTYEQARKGDGQEAHFIKPMEIAAQLLDAIKDDQPFLRQVYTLYAGGKDEGYIASKTIARMKSGDDAYFKKVFEEAKGDHAYHLKTEALRKITDLTYVKKVITEDAKVEEGAANPGTDFLLMRGEELYRADPHFVDALADSAVDTYVREAAIGATSNRTILEKYAGLTDIDQHKHEPESEAAHRAFHNYHFYMAATRKLASLKQK